MITPHHHLMIRAHPEVVAGTKLGSTSDFARAPLRTLFHDTAVLSRLQRIYGLI